MASLLPVSMKAWPVAAISPALAVRIALAFDRTATAIAAAVDGLGVASDRFGTTKRFDAEIVDACKATGEGWQTRMNDALKEWLQARPAWKTKKPTANGWLIYSIW